MKSEFRIFLSTGVSGDAAGWRVCMNKRVEGRDRAGGQGGGRWEGGGREEGGDALTFMGMFQAM